MDAYDRQARLYPAAAVAAPATLLALTLLSLPKWWSGLIGFAVTGGLHLIVVQIVRDLGTGQQTKLFGLWGGTPTTVRMRWASATNRTLHQRRHDDVAAGTGVALPTAEQEVADPAAADEAYETAATVLREKTRNADEHGMVKTEVTHYGFRRNLYGCRPFGIAVAAVCALAEVVLALLGWRNVVDANVPLMLAVAVISVTWFAGWILVVTPTFVRRSADRYADSLISASTRLK